MDDIKRTVEILNKILVSETITDVANELYFTQPYVSKFIKSIEKKYELLLVDRSNHPISLTEAGIVLLNDLQHILEAEKIMNNNLRVFKSNNRIITIAVSNISEFKELYTIIINIRKMFPFKKIRVLEMYNNLTENNLIDGTIDIFIGRKWNNSLFHIETLSCTELALLIPPSCCLFNENKKFIDFSENHLSTLNGCDYISLTDQSLFYRRINSFLKENNIFIKPILEVPNIKLATKIAIELNATTITSKKMVEESVKSQNKYNLMMIPNNKINLEVSISYFKDASIEVKQIADYISAYFLNI